MLLRVADGTRSQGHVFIRALDFPETEPTKKDKMVPLNPGVYSLHRIWYPLSTSTILFGNCIFSPWFLVTFVEELLLCEHDGGLGIGDEDKHVAVQAELVNPVVCKTGQEIINISRVVAPDPVGSGTFSLIRNYLFRIRIQQE